MQSVIRLTLFLALVFTPFVSIAADSENEIKQMLGFFSDEWNDGELDSIRGFFHKDFVLVTENVMQTKEQRLGDIEMIMSSDKDHGELTFSDVQVKMLGNEHAMAYGQSSLEFKDGTELSSMFSSVYVKTPFGWKVILTHD